MIEYNNIVFEICNHEPFDYRPYRRGQRRCLTCGAHRQFKKFILEGLKKLIYQDNMLHLQLRAKQSGSSKILIPLQYSN